MWRRRPPTGGTRPVERTALLWPSSSSEQVCFILLMVLQPHELTMISNTHSIFADFYQFYIEPCSNGAIDLPMWPEGAIEQVRVATNGHAIAVRTESSKEVPVTVEVIAAPPDDDLREWDHVTECSIDVNTGCISLTSPSVPVSDGEQIVLPAGSYRLRVYFGGLGSGEAESDSAEYYRIVLWQLTEHDREGVVVLKAARGA
jgi:hypothetical protein